MNFLIPKKQAVILIISHKSNPSRDELASLKQCYTILSKHSIKLICPSGLDVSKYLKIIPNIEIDFIEPKWQSNYAMFNRLKIDPFLYKRYNSYDFILFYELDAWVFRDDLTYWCNKGYDYIGAPWYEGYTYANNDSPFIGVGNGGFSLRKISTHLKALNRFSYLYPPTGFMANLSLYQKFNPKNVCKLLLNLTIKNNTFYLFNDFQKNEDYFWCSFVNQNFKWFSIPTENIAAQFAFEKKASLLYERNQNQLPFGCHGWYKYEKEFWKQHIDFKDDYKIS